MGEIHPTQDRKTIECGEEAANEFAFADGYRNLNHGSYGTYPIAVRSIFREYQEQTEARPDHFVRYEYRTHLLDDSRGAIADYLKAPAETCVFVPNTTNGIDTVLRNLVYAPGDVMICFATAYPSFRYTLRYLCDTTPLELKQIEYTLPVSDDYLVEAFEQAIQDVQAQNKVPRLALFDTISSLPGVRMPFERLTKVCKQYNVYSCIDGAHGVGHIPLNLSGLDPDFFASNLHKWLHVPRGCAVLYVPVRNQHVLRVTLPTGYGFDEGYIRNFSDLGTLDSTPYLCVQAALEWRSRLTWSEKQGEEAAILYNLDLARAGGKAVAQILETEVLENEAGTLGNCALTNVRLPLDTANGSASIAEVAKSIMNTMIVEHQTAVNVYCYGGALWVRLSAQVYLTTKDFEYAGSRLKDICERAQQNNRLV